MTAEVLHISCCDVVRFGQGERTLLMLPGLSVKPLAASAQAVALAYSDFCDDYTVLLADRRREVRCGITIEDMADDAAAVLRELKIKKCDVFGVSQGGSVALSFAIKYGGFVNKLAVCSTCARENSYTKTVIGSCEALARDGKSRELSKSFAQNVYSPAFYEKYKSVLEAAENDGTQPELERFAELCGAFRGFDIFENLDKITCPSAVFADKNDCVLGFDGNREIALALGCKFFVSDDFSHAVYDEDEGFKRRLLSFLRE